MRDLHPDLAASLDSGATTLARCIRLIRRDGVVLGFTDHDAPLTVDGTLFEPADGFEASQESASLGPSAGEWDLTAALTDDRITQADMLAGLYDAAAVDSLLVDWSNTDAFELISSGTLGDVAQRDSVFHAEVRGPFAAFDRVRGRVFSARCDAELGDGRCGVDLSASAHRLSGTVESASKPHVIALEEDSSHASGDFVGGTLALPNGTTVRIKEHHKSSHKDVVTLWHAPFPALEPGDAVTLTVGCDKSLSCCAQRFSNTVNFRGFPFMPGDDFALSYPAQDDGNLDGGSLKR